jgi:hypothetical protein
MLKPIPRQALNGYFAAGVSFAIFAPDWNGSVHLASPPLFFSNDGRTTQGWLTTFALSNTCAPSVTSSKFWQQFAIASTKTLAPGLDARGFSYVPIERWGIFRYLSVPNVLINPESTEVQRFSPCELIGRVNAF